MPTSNPPRLRSEAVHDRLRREILSGRHAPGDPLPSERSLSESHRVNRHAVREAIKRLQQAGLVQVSQGGATRVLEWRATGGLDLLGDLARTDEFAPLSRGVDEMRASIGADAARLCALRADDALRAQLPFLAAALPDPASVRRFETRFRAYEAFWARIVDGSGNLAYRLALNSLADARDTGSIDTTRYAVEVDHAREAAGPLADAIARGDADRAYALARELLERCLRPQDA
jgi:GntR family transcriptional regulator, transcriptional repressor for pyruvate dehydrogenase complex